ncbi:response regulator [Tessaracoccus defluvii]|uniref:hypothetical protein n=1 Tax=Tessaracoccus defluvii TaxID=1285901 RepID=UPI0029FF3966|nr:hypothetical protein [Tessaracoccus defluvii]
MSTILIIEDEDRIASFVAKGLKAAGFTSHRTASGVEGPRWPSTATSTSSSSTSACPTSTASRCWNASGARASTCR